MLDPLQKPNPFALTSTILVVLFILFAVMHWNRSVARTKQHVQKNAGIIANSARYLNQNASTEYLNTIAEHSDYTSITIRNMDGRTLASAKVSEQSTIDQLLISLHLIPEVPLTAPIIYKYNQIGYIDIFWRNKSIYMYFYAFILTILSISTLYLYLRMQDSKKNFEKEIQNRIRTLHESEQRFRAIFDNHYQLTGLISPDGMLISANRSSLMMVKCKEEDIIGMPFCDCPWWPKRSTLHEDIKKAVQKAQSGKFVRLELIFKDNANNPRVVDFSLKPVFNENKELIYIVPEGRDISILKQAQQEKLREKQFSDAVIDSLPGIFYVYNENLELIKWNRSLETLSGYSPEELRNKSLLSWFAPEKRSIVRKWAKRRLNNIPSNMPLELNPIAKDGSSPVYLYSTSTVKLDSIKYLIGTGIDISDRKKMEAELQQAQKMEAIGTLAGGIAHDFNNILSAIIGYTELSQLELRQEPRVSGFLAGIHQAAIRARDLVQQILTFSRKKDNSRLPLQIAPLLNEALRLIRSSIPTTINIETNIDARDAMVLADPTQIHRVFVNLCTNAYQAIGENNGTLKVSMQKVTIDRYTPVPDAGLPAGKYIKISISDSGRGMDKETMKRIFEPYYTTREAGKGTGLGLALVDSIIREHEGTITVESILNMGTTFVVYLPMITIKSEKKIKEQFQHTPTIINGNNIVCVDDEPYLLSILQDFLHEQGLQTTCFTGGTEALEYIRTTTEPIDLVITDMTMPNMSGLDLGREIFSSQPKLPVILCTGYSRSINKKKALEEGFSRYLEKPVSLADLTSAIHEVLAETT